MNKIIVFLFFVFSALAFGQEVKLKRGGVTDLIPVEKGSNETFSVFLPSKFDAKKEWPIIFLIDTQGKSKQTLGFFKNIAEKHGYILAAANAMHDSLTTPKNVVAFNKVFNNVASMLPLKSGRVYTAGFSTGGRIASLIPAFNANINGVISCGATIGNRDVLNVKNPFQFIGIIGNEDFNYTEVVANKKLLNRLGFASELIVFNGGHEWPKIQYLDEALKKFTLDAMAKGIVAKDSIYVEREFGNDIRAVHQLLGAQELLAADAKILSNIAKYRSFKVIDTLKSLQQYVKKLKLYKTQKRSESSFFLKESLVKDEFNYYLEEDIITYNFNNLGWWKYQMEQLQKHQKSGNKFERQMGKRLEGYLNAFIDDNVDLILSEEQLDVEALSFLWMLKTITAPADFDNYLKLIAHSAMSEDFGTALFYLEELLKQGFKDKDKLYKMENAALFRISPEFKVLMEKYFN